MVTINELIDAMKKFKKIPDTKLQKIADVLDEDHDGNIDISHAMKVRPQCNIKWPQAPVSPSSYSQSPNLPSEAVVN